LNLFTALNYVSKILQRLQSAVIEESLPTKTDVVIKVQLSNVQQTLYTEQARTMGSGGNSLLNCFHQLYKTWTHPLLILDAQTEKAQGIF
jgi:SNF2 family DNA or RNA helicase